LGNFPAPDIQLIAAAELIKEILRTRCPMDDHEVAITVLAVEKADEHNGTGLIVSPSGGFLKGQQIFNALLGYQHWRGGYHAEFRPFWHWEIYFRPLKRRGTPCGEPKALYRLSSTWPGWKVTGYACFWWTTKHIVTRHRIDSSHTANERYMTPCDSCAALAVPK
jgi:hypothetical protein